MTALDRQTDVSKLTLLRHRSAVFQLYETIQRLSAPRYMAVVPSGSVASVVVYSVVDEGLLKSVGAGQLPSRIYCIIRSLVFSCRTGRAHNSWMSLSGISAGVMLSVGSASAISSYGLDVNAK